FIFIAESLNKMSKNFVGIWDDKDGFFYDQLIFPDSTHLPIKTRSIAGMLALAAVFCIEKDVLERLPKFRKSVSWFVKYRRDKLKYSVIQDYSDGNDLLLSLVPKDRMEKLMKAL